MNKEEAVYPTVSPPAPIHPREEERIARLLGYDILDSGEDPLLDRLTKLAAEITGSPISLISLIDDKRQWIKSHYGTEIRETSREDSFCRHTILEPKEGELIVNDALTDKRFINNKFVTGEPHIRFYVGIPLDAGDGLAIGSLCVIDQKPNSLSQEQIKSLHSLASIVMDYITIHRSNRELTNLLMREKEVYSNLLRASSKMAIEAPTFDDALHSLIEHLDPKLGYLSCRIRNMQTGGTTGIIYNPLLPKDPELPLLWVQLDSAPQHPTGDAATTEFISTASLRPEF
jgi:GAF domain-containing protein